MSFYLLKFIHLFSIVLFLGNIIVTAFWKVAADLSKNWRIIAFSQRLVSYTDCIFTAPCVLIISISGVMLAHQHYGNFWHISWVLKSIYLWGLSGAIWLFILIPVQIKLHRIANTFSSQQNIPEIYWRYERIWGIFGIIATILPIINMYWAIYK